MSSKLLADDILKYRGGLANNNLLEILKNMENYDDMVTCCSESPYIDIQNASSYLNRFKNKFTVLDLNIQSLNAKFDTFMVFINELSSSDFFFSAICIQETWIRDSTVHTHNFDIPNYSAVFLPAVCSSHSGLVIYVHESFRYKIIDALNPSTDWESLFLEIDGGGLYRKLTLGNIYRPPRDRNSDIENFITTFTPFISNLANSTNDCVITGDFNIDLLKIESRSLYSEYIELIYSLSFIPTISLPTRLSRKKATLIDHIFYKSASKSNTTNGGIIVSNISDHLMPFICLDKNVKRAILPKTVSYQTSDTKSINNFVTAVGQIDFSSHINADLNTDPNITYEVLKSLLVNSVNVHLPFKSEKIQ